jgi:hypothetical protein
MDNTSLLIICFTGGPRKTDGLLLRTRAHNAEQPAVSETSSTLRRLHFEIPLDVEPMTVPRSHLELLATTMLGESHISREPFWRHLTNYAWHLVRNGRNKDQLKDVIRTKEHIVEASLNGSRVVWHNNCYLFFRCYALKLFSIRATAQSSIKF